MNFKHGPYKLDLKIYELLHNILKYVVLICHFMYFMNLKYTVFKTEQ